MTPYALVNFVKPDKSETRTQISSEKNDWRIHFPSRPTRLVSFSRLEVEVVERGGALNEEVLLFASSKEENASFSSSVIFFGCSIAKAPFLKLTTDRAAAYLSLSLVAAGAAAPVLSFESSSGFSNSFVVGWLISRDLGDFGKAKGFISRQDDSRWRKKLQKLFLN